MATSKAVTAVGKAVDYLAPAVVESLLKPRLDQMGTDIGTALNKKGLISRVADQYGNLGEFGSSLVRRALTDTEPTPAPATDIAAFKEANFKKSGGHQYQDEIGGDKVSPSDREVLAGQGFPEAYFRTEMKTKPGAPDALADDVPAMFDNETKVFDQINLAPNRLAGQIGPYIPAGDWSGAPPEQTMTVSPSSFSKNVGISNLDAIDTASDVAKYGAIAAGIGATAYGFGQMFGGEKPRSAYHAAVQGNPYLGNSGNPSVDAAAASAHFNQRNQLLKYQLAVDLQNQKAMLNTSNAPGISNVGGMGSVAGAIPGIDADMNQTARSIYGTGLRL